MAALSFNVNPGFGSWSAEGFGPYVDQVTVDDAPPELVRFAAHAHSAGVIEVTEGLDESFIETQEAGERAYTAAQGTWVERVWNPDGTATPGYWSGGWHVGNQAQYDLEQAQKRVAAAKADGDPAELKAAEDNLAAVDKEIQERIAA